jgi:hypothetical protein
MDRIKGNSTVLLQYTNEQDIQKDKCIINKENKVEVKELKLKPEKKVTWTEDTIDNEHMNKKKSKSNFFK